MSGVVLLYFVNLNSGFVVSNRLDPIRFVSFDWANNTVGEPLREPAS